MTADEEPLTRRADRWLGLVAVFVAPTTVITGLCYFLGFVSTRHRLLWFGVDPGALGFTTTDYAVKTVADYFVRVFELLLVCVVILACALIIRRLANAERLTPILRAGAWAMLAAAVLCVCVAAASLKSDIVAEVPSSLLMTAAFLTAGAVLLFAGWRLALTTAKFRPPWPHLARVTSLVLVSLGAVCVLNAFLWPFLRYLWGPHGSPFMTWTLFIVGTGMFVAGYWILLITRSPAQLERSRALAAGEPVGLALAIAVIVVSLFALTDQYAVRSGDRDGEEAQKALWGTDIGVVLETSSALPFPDDMVKTTRIEPESASSPVTYRYDCLRVVEIRANRWVLVPAKWTRETGYAAIVAPDASNRITTTVHSGLGAQTGSGDNVQRYWPCPEAVPTYAPSDLEGKLLTADDVQRVVGEGSFESESLGAPMQTMTGAEFAGPTPTCVTTADNTAVSGLVPAYGAVTGAKEQALSSSAGATRVWVDQAVTTFATPGEAFAFVATAKEIWRGCANSVVGVARHGAIAPRRLGKLHANGQVGIPWVEDASPDADQPSDCSQALVAKSNIVIDVDTCGSQPRAAMLVAKAIRDKIPTSGGMAAASAPPPP